MLIGWWTNVNDIAAYQETYESLDVFCAPCNEALFDAEGTVNLVQKGVLRTLTRYEARGLACWECSRIIAPLEEHAR